VFLTAFTRWRNSYQTGDGRTAENGQTNTFLLLNTDMHDKRGGQIYDFSRD